MSHSIATQTTRATAPWWTGAVSGLLAAVAGVAAGSGVATLLGVPTPIESVGTARRDILESILDPSKVISEQLAFTTNTKKDGTQITGRIADDNAQKVSVIINPLAPDARVDIPAAQIAKREHS